MLISVVVTVYNLERYVEQAILSLLEQSYAALEIIIVDDCSTDQSAEIIKKYISRLKYIRTKKNSGVLLATIDGLSNATGDIICFLDGDDIWHKDKALKIANAFQSDETIFMVSHDYEYIDGNGNKLFRTDQSQEILKKNLLDSAFINITMRKSVLGYFGNVWLGSAYCIKNNKAIVNAFVSWAAQLPDPQYTYQDHPLACFWITHNDQGRLSYIDQKLLQYRIHENNYSGAYHSKETARKLALKAYNTSIATLAISELAEIESYLIGRQKSKLSYYEFLLSLFDKKFIKAFFLNVKLCFTFYSGKDILKEWIRYYGILFLGNNFFKMMNKK